MRWREVIARIGSVATAWSRPPCAQPQKIWRIGFLANDPTIPQQAAGKAFVCREGAQAEQGP